ncbi:Ribonucleases P/MRP protein subunit pop1 [Batrachochytrium dendrobatidis]|nr:Ribonucleases P/MRP protein subunit pop1 [Batrachochytrium dendrobatidis]KAK5668639.1 Ribonucleases P/MRP protein subunit pop1 [Batrachochytrium dendrobatidis]
MKRQADSTTAIDSSKNSGLDTPGLNAKQRKKIKQQMHVQGVSEPVYNSKDIASNSLKQDKSITTLPPRQLQINEVIQARSFEISSLETALSNATEYTGAQRVFQTLPRHMRRRAASYNVKRLPMHIRKRALVQMSKDKTCQNLPKHRYKKRKATHLSEEFMKRPAHNKWLETHVWHAKRMKMVEKWGYKLADHPNDKNLRSAFRSSKNQSVIHDASYIQPIELNGPELVVVKLLQSFLDPTFPNCAQKDYLNGSRHLVTFFHKRASYPAGAIGLVEILWKPYHQVAGNALTDIRTVWLFTHPDTHERILKLLKEAIELPTSLVSNTPVSIVSLKGEFCRFEFCGPRSHAILSECLQLCSENTDLGDVNSISHSVWQQLYSLISPTSVSPGVVLGLTVQDPRLSFPIKMKSRNDAQPSFENEQVQSDVLSLLKEWPAGVAYQSSIWDKESRKVALDTRATNVQINARRSMNLIPGTPLAPSSTDSRIPILLIHRANYYSMQFSRGEYSDGWDLVIPRGWAKEFWLTFIFSGARVAGLREKRSFHFEAAIPCFPYDYPETPTYDDDTSITCAELEKIYNRTPKAKRPNYESLQVPSPFAPLFHQLEPSISHSIAEIESVCTIFTQPTTALTESAQITQKVSTTSFDLLPGKSTTAPIVVLHSPSLIQLIHNLSHALPTYTALCSVLAEKLTALSYKTGSLISSDVLSDLKSAFVRVVITPIKKGAPQERGIVYAATESDISTWHSLASSMVQYSFSSQKKASTLEESDANLDDIPSKDRILGYLTTGHFSLRQGQGQAIGCCSLAKLYNAMQVQNAVLKGSMGLTSKDGRVRVIVFVRGITDRICRPALLEIIS